MTAKQGEPVNAWRTREPNRNGVAALCDTGQDDAKMPGGSRGAVKLVASASRNEKGPRAIRGASAAVFRLHSADAYGPNRPQCNDNSSGFPTSPDEHR